MKLFKTLICTLFSLLATAQTIEYKVGFKEYGNKEWATSQVFVVNQYEALSFVGITAYTLNVDKEGALAYRVASEGDWQEWNNMKEFHEGQTPGRTVYEGVPVFMGFDSIQFKGDRSLIGDWTFRLFFGGLVSSESNYSSASSSTPCPMPSYCDRICWCDTCPKDNTPTPTIPSHLIIHHSAGFSSAPDYKQVMAYYWDFHVNTNGWDDIGYNWLIDPNGVIYEGRGSNTLAAHFSCMNSNTLGICMIGNYVSNPPSDTALKSLEAVLAYEAYQNNIDPDGMSYHSTSQLTLYNISSHRDGNSATAPGSCPKGTVCPGDSLYALLPMIRQNLQNRACMQGVGMDELRFIKSELFPNPAEGQVIVDLLPGERLEGVYNSVGIKVISVSETQEQKVSLNVSHLASGVYFVRVVGDGNYTLKMLKK